MKNIFLFTATLLMTLALAGGGVAAYAYFRGIGTGAEQVDVPGGASYTAPTPTPKPAGTPAAGLPAVTPPAGGVTAPAATPTPAPVGFLLGIQQTQAPQSRAFLNVSVDIFLRAALDNTGDFDAHNVSVTARAKVGPDYVAIDGKQALIVPVGPVAARSAVARDLKFTLTMSLAQGRTAQAEGIVFEIVITSEEATSFVPAMRCTATGCAPA